MNCARCGSLLDYEELLSQRRDYETRQRFIDYGERLREIARETSDKEQREFILQLAKRYDER